ncbi:SPOR domain-containing protein [Thalassospira sp. TSL5-1]|uniref:SPOR domain-containing protein n=1 Tax=Thalassospira sp. TSL5-1 TaxID=1544451 RepID=UPI00093EA708|nr:SPOR domain-containing protein [Thalassospira sp. TSL5-1]OKH89691.1 hypothetical protein LF95_07145 [Thalassospira sp. TSL5-1]
MSAVIKTATKPAPAPDPFCDQGWLRLRAASLASAAMTFGLVLLIATGTAQAQNADLNSNDDTVSGINAIPTNLPGSARTITGQPAPSSGPLDLLELAKQHRQAYQARTNTPDSQTADFRLSSQYRHSTGKAQKKAGTRHAAQNPDVIQASIMTSETGASKTALAWTKPQTAHNRAQTEPKGSVTAPVITKPTITPPTHPTVQRAQIVTPWSQSQTPQQAGEDNTPPNLNKVLSTPAAVSDSNPSSNDLFAIPSQPTPNATPATIPVTEPATQDASGRSQMQQPMPPRPTATATATAINAADMSGKTANGNYAVQLGAFRSAIGAETYWASFAVRYPQLAETYHHYLGTVDIAGKGQFHRLRMGGFASLDAAKEKCRQLQADGIECIGLAK